MFRPVSQTSAGLDFYCSSVRGTIFWGVSRLHRTTNGAPVRSNLFIAVPSVRFTVGPLPWGKHREKWTRAGAVESSPPAACEVRAGSRPRGAGASVHGRGRWEPSLRSSYGKGGRKIQVLPRRPRSRDEPGGPSFRRQGAFSYSRGIRDGGGPLHFPRRTREIPLQR